MSDTQGATDAPAKRPTEVKTIVKQSSVGHPAIMVSNPEKNKMVLGKIIGVALGTSTSTIEDQETGEEKKLVNLTGSFRAIPNDESLPITTSGKLGLPSHISGPIVVAVRAVEAERGSIEIALELGVERAKNAAGYSWFARPLFEDVGNPLDALLARVEGRVLIAPPANTVDAETGEVEKAKEPEKAPAPASKKK